MDVEPIPMEEFLQLYAEKSQMEVEDLRAIFERQNQSLWPVGWFMVECQLLDSSYAGSVCILPYGGKATFQSVPNHPISPRGLASDTSTVIAITENPERKDND